MKKQMFLACVISVLLLSTFSYSQSKNNMHKMNKTDSIKIINKMDGMKKSKMKMHEMMNDHKMMDSTKQIMKNNKMDKMKKSRGNKMMNKTMQKEEMMNKDMKKMEMKDSSKTMKKMKK